MAPFNVPLSRPAMAALNEDRLEDIIGKCERSGDWGLLRTRWGILKAKRYFIFLHQKNVCLKLRQIVFLTQQDYRIDALSLKNSILFSFS